MENIINIKTLENGLVLLTPAKGFRLRHIATGNLHSEAVVKAADKEQFQAVEGF